MRADEAHVAALAGRVVGCLLRWRVGCLVRAWVLGPHVQALLFAVANKAQSEHQGFNRSFGAGFAVCRLVHARVVAASVGVVRLCGVSVSVAVSRGLGGGCLVWAWLDCVGTGVLVAV